MKVKNFLQDVTGIVNTTFLPTYSLSSFNV